MNEKCENLTQTSENNRKMRKLLIRITMNKSIWITEQTTKDNKIKPE